MSIDWSKLESKPEMKLKVDGQILLDFKAKIHDLELELIQHKEDLEKTQEIVSEKETSIKILTDKFSSTESELNESEKKIQSNAEQINSLTNQNAELMDQLAKIKEDLSLNRRVRGDSAVNFFKSLDKGDVYEDKSFSSTSLHELPQFGEFNIEILAKKGSNVSSVDNSTEYEYLIDKGSKFKVLDKSDTGIIVELL